MYVRSSDEIFRAVSGLSLTNTTQMTIITRVAPPSEYTSTILVYFAKKIIKLYICTSQISRGAKYHILTELAIFTVPKSCFQDAM